MPTDGPTPHPVDDASVLIAGATGGLGSAIATELDRRGATLTLVARSADRLGALTVPGERLAVDLRSAEACEAAVDAAVEHGGGLDVVVNAVGIVAFGPVADLSVDTMEEVFLTNVFVTIMLARAAAARMRPGGAIVNISGVVAEQNFPGMAAYGASKAAVRSFDEALARELRRSQLRVLDARPPHTETGLADRAIDGRPPKMPRGADPATVARRICDAIERGETDLPSASFTPT